MGIDFALVGRRIREARTNRGLTGEQLAERIGLATESLRHIENAANNPSLQTLYRIAEVLGVSMDYITGRTPALADSMIQAYGLEPRQEKMLQDILNSVVPIITNYV